MWTNSVSIFAVLFFVRHGRGGLWWCGCFWYPCSLSRDEVIKMFSLQWSNESQAAQENSTRIKLQRVCIYYVRLCSLCLLPDFSSNFSARFVSGQSLSTSSLSLHTHLSSPLPGVLLLVPWISSALLLTDASIHSFVHLFTGKVFDRLITTDFTDSSPPSYSFRKTILSWIHFLVYISAFTTLFTLFLSSTRRLFPFMKKMKICF